MKKTILSIAIAAILSSCGNNAKPVDPVAINQTPSAADTSGLAEYQNWKQQKEQLQELNMQGVTDAPVENNDAVAYQADKPATKVIYRTRPAKAARVVRYKAPEVKYSEPDYTSSTPKTYSSGKSREAVSRNDAGVAEGGNTTGEGVGTANGPVATADPVPAKKEGWSKAAKGAVIGAGSGAVLGAIIGKNKAKGAVIGGVIGGVGGYVLGRAKDKKDGRYLVAN